MSRRGGDSSSKEELSTPLLDVSKKYTFYTEGKEESRTPRHATPDGQNRSFRSRQEGSAINSAESFRSLFRSNRSAGLSEFSGDPIAAGAFPVTAQELSQLHSDRNLLELERCGGIAGVVKSVRSDVKKGVTQNSLHRRYDAFGRNEYPEPPLHTFWEHFQDGLDDTTIRILIAAGIFSLIIEMATAEDKDERSKAWIEGFAILLAVACVGLVAAWNNYSKERQFRSLNTIKNNRAVRVIRDGVQQQAFSFDIAVGDIICLDAGDMIPADGFLINGFDIEVDESAMTGESDTLKKGKEDPFMLSGCQITQGTGVMIATGVGVNSEWGRLLSALAEEREDTPLQMKLAILAEQIGKFGVAAAVLTFSVLMIRWVVEAIQEFETSDLTNILDYFIIGVTIVVIAVPEGLPLAITISLAYSMKRMYEENNLVRHLEACETMGGVTNICSDKTGTLTENRMTVVQMWISGSLYEQVPTIEETPNEISNLFTEAVSLNSNANIRTLPNGKIDYLGNKTECALLLQCQTWGRNYLELREKAQIDKIYPFTSDRKRMTVVLAPSDEKRRVYTKGASEIILSLCTAYVDKDGEASPISEDLRQELLTTIDTMANQALRTLCIAYADVDDAGLDLKIPPENNLTLIAIVGIQDPLRAEVPAAVDACKRAGIIVRMVTGDNISTAKAIARQCGILTDGIAMEGPEFRKLTPSGIDNILDKLQVLARSSPADKYTLVKHLRQRGEIVGVTGDGTNDAPALKEADIGLAMGLSGTEVAKEASDMIIMDDNFSTIVNAVLWGRCVFDNIRKFLQFQMTITFTSLALAFIGGVVGKKPLTTVQFLWINLLMDSWAALALGTEYPTSDLLDRKPYGRFEPLINANMIRNIIGQGMCQLTVLLTIFFGCDFLYDTDCECGGERSDDFQDECEADGTPMTDDSGKGSEQYTLIFNCFVFMQIFNEFNCRRIDNNPNIFQNLSKNYAFMTVIFLSISIQIIIVEYGGEFTQTVSLDFRDWMISVLSGLSMFVSGYLLRFVESEKYFSSLVPHVVLPTDQDDDEKNSKEESTPSLDRS